MKHEKQIVETNSAPKAIGPYNVGVTAGPFVFTSGQIGINPDTGQIVEGGVVNETIQALKNIQAILEAAGSNMSLTVKTTIFLTDLGDFGKVNETYATFFSEKAPARSTVEVSKLPKGANVEIEVIALSGGNCS